MSKPESERWCVPEWNESDRQLINGYIPTDTDLCFDPIGARLYLIYKARSRIQAVISKNKTLTLRDKARTIYRVNKELLSAKTGVSLPVTLGQQALLRIHAMLSSLTSSGKFSLGSRKTTIDFEPLSPSSAVSKPWWQDLSAVADQVEACGGTLLIQGSQADGETTAFSDVDLWLMGDMRDDKIRSLKFELDDIVIAADPLQHHGVFWADSLDAKIYWPMQLPVETLARAKTISRPTQLTLHEFFEPYGAATHLRNTIQQWESLLAGQNRPFGMWGWKFKLSEFMLIPTLLSATGGINIYKGDSFTWAKSLYTSKAWQAMDVASKIRRDWPACEEAESYRAQAGRKNGVLEADCWPVTESTNLLVNDEFLNQAKTFLEETRSLARL